MERSVYRRRRQPESRCAPPQRVAAPALARRRPARASREFERNAPARDRAAALRGIAGIDDAQVIIAPGRSAAFADESSSPPSASVRLRLKPGAQLGRQTIDGIRQFVADGVSGLAPTRVAILDDRGLALGETHAVN